MIEAHPVAKTQHGGGGQPTVLGTAPSHQLTRPDGSAVEVRVSADAVHQRNWSRVGRGTVDGQAVFVKQAHDARAQWQPVLHRREADSMEALHRLVPERVPSVLAESEPDLLLCYEHFDVVAADDIVRRDGRLSAQDEQAIVAAVQELDDVLEAWADEPPPDMRTKRRSYASAAAAVVPKGADIRNIGLRPDGPAIFFDAGALYLGPREELHAKWLASILLLNWGAPLSRYVRGPDLRLADRMIDALGIVTNPGAVVHELRRELRRAVREPMGATPKVRASKSAGSAVVGTPYYAICARWAHRRFG